MNIKWSCFHVNLKGTVYKSIYVSNAKESIYTVLLHYILYYDNERFLLTNISSIKIAYNSKGLRLATPDPQQIFEISLHLTF